METAAENVSLSDVEAVELTREPETATAERAKSVTPAKPMPRWVMATLVTHVAFLALFLWAVHTVGLKLDELGLKTISTNQDVEALEKRLTAVGAETKGLGSEISSLRQHIATSANEDVIFLKALILKPDIDPDLARAIAKHVHHYSQLYARDADLVLAMIAVESNFDPRAKSPVGATGLMQVMPQWKKVLGIDGDLMDPEILIKYGLQILGFYSEMYKDLEMSLTAYNRGPGPVDHALMQGKDPTNRYAPRVMQTYERMKKLSVSSKT